MNFDLSEEQQAIRSALQALCSEFGDDYWLARDRDGLFPEEFVDAVTAGGWLGIAMPQEYGGAGLGITEAAILGHAIARSGAGMSGASAVHLNLFGPHPIVVFDRPIGMNQAIQHPLAVNWMELEAAHLMAFNAAARYDAGQSCGTQANAAKYLAAEAALKACQRAVLTHGGMGYAREFHVERYLREIMIPMIAPISQELIMSFIAEKELNQPKSY